MTQGFVTTSASPLERGLAVGPGPGPPGVAPVAWYTGGHPLPNRGSLDAGHDALRYAAEMSPSGCLVVLLSGGASALLVVPVDGVTLAEKVDATRVLLAAGLPIHELNCVRKHLSAIKGGRLALAAAGRVLTLAISDVVGPVEDDPAVIGSGPTVVDQTTFAEAAAIVDRPEVRRRIPRRVRDVLERGRDGRVPETMKTNGNAGSGALYRVVGSRRQAMEAAASAARSLGYTTTLIDSAVVGEARVAGAGHPTSRRPGGRAAGRPGVRRVLGRDHGHRLRSWPWWPKSGTGAGGRRRAAPAWRRGGAGQCRYRRRGRPDRCGGRAGGFAHSGARSVTGIGARNRLPGGQRRLSVFRPARRSGSDRADRHQRLRSAGGGDCRGCDLVTKDPDRNKCGTFGASRRPSGQARGVRIPGVCNRRATPRGGMHRRPEWHTCSGQGPKWPRSQIRPHSAADASRTHGVRRSVQRGRILPVCSLLAPTAGCARCPSSGPSVPGRIYDRDH